MSFCDLLYFSVDPVFKESKIESERRRGGGEEGEREKEGSQ